MKRTSSRRRTPAQRSKHPSKLTVEADQTGLHALARAMGRKAARDWWDAQQSLATRDINDPKSQLALNAIADLVADALGETMAAEDIAAMLNDSASGLRGRRRRG